MSFWPSDTAGKIADAVSVAAFVISALAGAAAKATGGTVRRLERKFERRDLLPRAAKDYQEMYRNLQPLLSRSVAVDTIRVPLGELVGMLNGMNAYLTKTEQRTPKLIRVRIDLIVKEPGQPKHALDLLQVLGTFSAELDHIVEGVKWNKPS